MPQNKSGDNAAAESVAELLDEPENVLSELEREEAKIIARSEGRVQEEEEPEVEEEESSAESEIDEEPSRSVSTQDLLSKIDQLTGVVQALMQGKKPDMGGESDDEEGFDIEYDVGDLDEEYESLRPALNRMGQAVHRELAELQNTVQKLAHTVHSGFDEMSADKVREKYSVTPDEEDKIVNWARERGMRYENARQLSLVVGDYRKLHPKGEKPKKRESDDRAMAPSRPTGKKTFDKNEFRKPGRRTFNESFDRAALEIQEKIRTGRLPLV